MSACSIHSGWPIPVRFPRKPSSIGRPSGTSAAKPGDPPQVAPVWMLPRSCGPMGLINSTVGDVLTFAQLHLDAGKAPDGTQLVSAEGIAAMQRPQVESPDRHTLGSHWGLGEILFEWDGRRVYGHDGGTIGQSSRLRIVPDADLAITLVANGGETQRVYQEIFGELMAELAGIAMPRPLEVPAKPVDVDLASLRRLLRAAVGPLRPDARRRAAGRNGHAQRTDRRPDPRSRDEGDPHAGRRDDVPRRGRGVDDPRPGSVLRVPGRDPPVPAPRRPGQPPRHGLAAARRTLVAVRTLASGDRPRFVG